MELHPSQDIIAADTHDFRVVACGRQFGKTTLSVLEMVACAYAKKNRRVAYFATTYEQARNIAWALLKDIVKDIVAKPPNESRLEIHIYTQDGGTSEISLRGFENIETARGQQFDLLVIDEVAYMKNWQYAWEAILEPTLAFRHGKALFISTPNGYNFFHDLYIRGQTHDPYYKSWKFTSYDNPYLPKERIEQAKETSERSWFEQEYLAEFNKRTGVVYYEWDLGQFQTFFYDENLPLHLSWDFGVNDPTVILFIQPNGAELRIVDYYEASNADLNHFVSVIKERGYKQPDLETGDIAGRARTLLTGKSPISLLRELGHSVRSMPIPDIEQQIRNAHKFIPNLWVSHKAERFRDCLLNYHYPDKPVTLVNQDNEKPVHDWCIIGSMKVRTLNGWMEIKDLVGKEFYVWGYSLKENKLIPTKAEKCWLTKKNAEVIEVGLDDGHSITCTPNHKFLLRSKEYKEAKDLQAGDSLMPFYEQAQGPYIQIFLNDGSKGMEHHLVYQRFIDNLEPNTHIDHIDETHTNNNPDNLRKMTPAEHCSKTFRGKNNNERIKIVNKYIPYSSTNYTYKLCLGCNIEFRGDHKTFYHSFDCKNKYRARKFNNRWHVSERYRLQGQTSNKKYEIRHKKKCPLCVNIISRKAVFCRKHRYTNTLQKPNRYFQQLYNHKVRFVKPAKNEDVYDIEAPETQNFVCEGVVVHNSSHAMRAFEYYCWNRTHGGLGGVKERFTDPKEKKVWGARMDPTGGQLSINTDKFRK